jgi:hypothetical protein
MTRPKIPENTVCTQVQLVGGRHCWIYQGWECGVVDRGQTVIVKSGPRGLLTKGEAYYALCIPIAYLAIDYTIYSILQGLCLSAMLLRNAALTAECP